MRITIDASNLQEGGGIVHLKNLLQISDPRIHGFNKIIVYGGRKPLEQLSKKDWLDLREIKNLDRSIADRLIWQKNFLNKNVKQENSLLFIPGGLFLGNSVKFVTMFQNMQIFETLGLRFQHLHPRVRLVHARVGVLDAVRGPGEGPVLGISEFPVRLLDARDVIRDVPAWNGRRRETTLTRRVDSHAVS